MRLEKGSAVATMNLSFDPNDPEDVATALRSLQQLSSTRWPDRPPGEVDLPAVCEKLVSGESRTRRTLLQQLAEAGEAGMPKQALYINAVSMSPGAQPRTEPEMFQRGGQIVGGLVRSIDATWRRLGGEAVVGSLVTHDDDAYWLNPEAAQLILDALKTTPASPNAA
jgi:hypothetical protein